MKPENPQEKSPASLSHPEGQTDNENRYLRRFRTKKRSQIFFIFMLTFSQERGVGITPLFSPKLPSSSLLSSGERKKNYKNVYLIKFWVFSKLTVLLSLILRVTLSPNGFFAASQNSSLSSLLHLHLDQTSSPKAHD